MVRCFEHFAPLTPPARATCAHRGKLATKPRDKTFHQREDPHAGNQHHEGEEDRLRPRGKARKEEDVKERDVQQERCQDAQRGEKKRPKTQVDTSTTMTAL